MRHLFILCVALLLSVPSAVSAQQSTQQSLDGPSHIFKDALLDNFTGEWTGSGHIGSRTIHYKVTIEWVLNHQFLLIHLRDAAEPSLSDSKTASDSKAGSSTQAPYEALMYVGRDSTSDRYVAHWLDQFGGRWSETLAYGSRTGNEVLFVFEYPDGPFRSALTWDPDRKTWQWTMTQKLQSGDWSTFGVFNMSRP